MKTKIIYSLKIYTQLIILGFQPIATMPNPKDSKYTCWVFEDTEEFEKALGPILGGLSYGSK